MQNWIIYCRRFLVVVISSGISLCFDWKLRLMHITNYDVLSLFLRNFYGLVIGMLVYIIVGISRSA